MSTPADERRLKRAQDDAAAFTAEVRAVINAQRQQIAVLEKQAQQLANEAASEQRFASALVANDKAQTLTRLQHEHSQLGMDLDMEGRRALDLAGRLEAANAGKDDLRVAVSSLEHRRLAESKGKKTNVRFKMNRALSESDAMRAQAKSIREEVDHLRREKLVFLSKLRDIEVALDEERAQNDAYVHGIKDLSSKRNSNLSSARQLSDQDERRSRQRHQQRQQVDTQLESVEKQARTVRNKLKQKMMSNAIAASGGGQTLHKLRLQKAAWPPSNDNHGLLNGVPAPHTLREHVAVLAYLIGVPEDFEMICEKMAAEDREQGQRTRSLEDHRRELQRAEENNERLRKELGEVESTGGPDTAEHLSLREQLTEMQAQGVAIRNAEERHASVLEHLSAVAHAMLGSLDPGAARELQGVANAGGDRSGREGLAQTIEAALTAAKRRMEVA